MGIRTNILIITLSGKGLNAPTKRHRLAEWMQKQDLCMCCLQETHYRSRDTYRLKVRELKIFHANGNQKKAGIAVLISDKVDFKIKTITRDKKGLVLHNDQGINPRRRYNNYKYICTQHRSTSMYKATANSYKRGNQQ